MAATETSPAQATASQTTASPRSKTWVSGQPSRYELHDLTHFPDWRNIIVWDAFFNNLTSGFMVAFCVVWLVHLGPISEIAVFALSLAFVLVIVDLLLLIADLGDHFRFLHAMRVFRHTSALSVGVVGLIFYSIMLFIALVLLWLVFASNATTGFLGSWAHLIHSIGLGFTVLAFIGAAIVIVYKGVVFSSSAQPGVKKARWMTFWMVADSLLMGLGLSAIVACCLGQPLGVEEIAAPLMTLVVIRCIAYLLVGANVGERAAKVYGRMTFVNAIVVYLGGGLAPILLAALWVPMGIAVAGALVLICGVWERYYLVGLAKHL